MEKLPSVVASQPKDERPLADWVLWILSIYAVPLAVGVLSVIALLSWDDMYAARPVERLELRVFVQQQDETKQPTLIEALDVLQRSPSVPYFGAAVDAPIWFLFDALTLRGQDRIVELPSRSAVRYSCWEAASLRLLGDSTTRQDSSVLARVKTGYSLRLDSSIRDVVCKGTFVGPSKLAADLWQPAQFERSVEFFHRMTGIFDGGMSALAIFVLATALVTRQTIYAIFAISLVVTLRNIAISAGWDVQWFGYAIPPNWLVETRSVTRAAYAMLTLTLFRSLFQKELWNTHFDKALQATHWLCLPLLLAAVTVPRGVFIQLMWSVSLPGILVMVASLAYSLTNKFSRVALWYVVAFAASLVLNFYEVVVAILGVHNPIIGFSVAAVAATSILFTSFAIAERLRHESAMRLEAQASVARTYKAVPIGLFTLDLDGRFLSANPEMMKLLDNSALEDGDSTWRDCFGDQSWETLRRVTTLPSGRLIELELLSRSELRHQDTKRLLVKASLVDGKIEGSLQDATEGLRISERLMFLTNHDALTKTLNWQGIQHELRTATQTISAGSHLSFARLDLDQFSSVNAMFGHDAGDAILQQVSDRVLAELPPNSKLGRIGGNEFGILFSDTTIAMAALICRRIIDSLSTKPYCFGDKVLYVSASIGLVELCVGAGLDVVMSSASHACNRAKKNDVGGLVVYRSDSAEFVQQEKELKLVDSLSSDLAMNGMYLEMHPIMSLTTPYASLNFEVRVRFRDEENRVYRAEQVIAASEAIGRVSTIERWLVTNTLAWLDEHQAKLMNSTKFVCVSLSGASLRDPQFLNELYSELAKSRQVADKLCLGITESAALVDVNSTKQFIDRIRSFGAKVALDHFGAGYSSFSQIKNITADLLRIDGSLIVGMTRHPTNITIVETIVNMAKNLGMTVVAERVEDNATVQALGEIGVDYVQGSSVAYPQTPNSLLAAKSSANFISDSTLTQYINSIGQTDHKNPGLFVNGKINTLH